MSPMEENAHGFGNLEFVTNSGDRYIGFTAFQGPRIYELLPVYGGLRSDSGDSQDSMTFKRMRRYLFDEHGIQMAEVHQPSPDSWSHLSIDERDQRISFISAGKLTARNWRNVRHYLESQGFEFVAHRRNGKNPLA